MDLQEIRIENMYDLNETIAKELLEGKTYPWEVLPWIHDYILQVGDGLDKEEYDKVGEDIWIAKSATVAPTAYIHGPCIIGKHAEIRHCAFIRENAIVGDGVTVGNSTELKNVILFNGVEVPHYNYVGDSILGYKAHMGAGAVTSNIKADRKNVVVHANGFEIDTKMQKVGAMLGDGVEIGCNSVLNPGTIVGKHSNVYPLSNVRGVVKSNHIYKNKNEIVEKY